MEARRIFAGAAKSRRVNPIRILHLERNAEHSSLVKLKLKAEGVPSVLRRVENRADFIAALEKNDFDLILAECCLARFDGLTALEMARKKCPDLPFIFVTDAYREESTDLLYAGATDFVLKPTLFRLVPVIFKALAESEVNDDGIGFDPKAVSQQTDANSPTLGLIGMSQRVAGLGGMLEINSAPAQGTEVRIEIPLE